MAHLDFLRVTVSKYLAEHFLAGWQPFDVLLFSSFEVMELPGLVMKTLE